MYDTLADVYDWLVPEALLEPEGRVAAFEMVVGELPSGARVLDCACGTGTLAVGLALRSFEVSASDASEEMVARTRALAVRHGALAGMRGVLCDGGLLALTSRTWELQQEDGEEVVERGGRRARVTHTWQPGSLEVAVTFEDDGTTHAERLDYLVTARPAIPPP